MKKKVPFSVSCLSSEALLIKVDRGVADITRIKPLVESARFTLRVLTFKGTDNERVMWCWGAKNNQEYGKNMDIKVNKRKV